MLPETLRLRAGGQPLESLLCAFCVPSNLWERFAALRCPPLALGSLQSPMLVSLNLTRP